MYTYICCASFVTRPAVAFCDESLESLECCGFSCIAATVHPMNSDTHTQTNTALHSTTLLRNAEQWQCAAIYDW